MTSAILLLSLCFNAGPNDVAAEEKAIRAFLVTRQDAFEREDSKWLVGHFTENGEHIDSAGKSAKGKDQIEKAYRTLFDAPGHKDVKAKHTIEEIRCVTPDVGIVNAGWSMSGLKDEKGKPLPDRGGRSIMVVVKKDGEWKIDLLRADLKVHAANQKPTKPESE